MLRTVLLLAASSMPLSSLGFLLPSSSSMNESFSRIRRKHFAQLDRSNVVYLDHTGACPVPRDLPLKHAELLSTHVYANPHSSSLPSEHATAAMERARNAVLRFFHAREHEVIFTANASAAIHLVAQTFPFSSCSTLYLAADNHNSVLALREAARHAGGKTVMLPLDSRLRLAQPHSYIRQSEDGTSLLAYPAQSNFSGIRHDLSLVPFARGRNVRVLLDAAAYAPTSELDLSVVDADFVPLSFYKMFGYPTGIGALIVRKDAMQMLRKQWFAGGTVKFVSVSADLHVLHDGVDAFQDGTVDFLSFPAVVNGLRFLSKIGMSNITKQVSSLTHQLLHHLHGMRYANGRRMTVIYGPDYDDCTNRGGTVSMDLLDNSGRRFDCHFVEKEAGRRGLAIRAGCFCNPGCAERVFDIDAQSVVECVREGRSAYNCTDGIGCVRVSVGVASVKKDVKAFISFVSSFCATHGVKR
ncbi:Pyridoxal phosphate-dependent transferase [Gracilaria domingensis]|nr:Pyridoxal phosphate-dependent transferase [Gracilaria domingensis]